MSAELVWDVLWDIVSSHVDGRIATGIVDDIMDPETSGLVVNPVDPRLISVAQIRGTSQITERPGE